MFIGETGEQDETGEQGETRERGETGEQSELGETGTPDALDRSDASASPYVPASSVDHQLYQFCRCILSGKLLSNSYIKG